MVPPKWRYLALARRKRRQRGRGATPGVLLMCQGTVLLIVTFPSPWPCAARTQIVRREPITIYAEPNGSLLLQIAAADRFVEFCSCPLIFPDGRTSTNVGVSWNLPHAVNMIVGQTVVLCTENPDLVPTQARISSGLPKDPNR
jgi:hypothetical protein